MKMIDVDKYIIEVKKYKQNYSSQILSDTFI